MIKFFAPYNNNKKAAEPEQAAGFPPFTRGYSSLHKNTQLSIHAIHDLSINEYSDESIIKLFKEIITLKRKGALKLNIPFEGNVQEVLYVRILRTLLSFVSNKLHNSPEITQFEFYGIPEYSKNKLNTLTFAKAAQVDYLIIENLENWLPFELLSPKVPVDSLYGSEYFQQEFETTFFRLWNKIMISLT